MINIETWGWILITCHMRLVIVVRILHLISRVNYITSLVFFMDTTQAILYYVFTYDAFLIQWQELLALEERMGSVSTALTEDDLLKCLKRSIYQSIPPEGAGLVSSGDKDDMICSICQVFFLPLKKFSYWSMIYK